MGDGVERKESQMSGTEAWVNHEAKRGIDAALEHYRTLRFRFPRNKGGAIAKRFYLRTLADLLGVRIQLREMDDDELAALHNPAASLPTSSPEAKSAEND